MASPWPTLFDDADAPERRETQYFEMVCNRGIYHKGWTAVTRHSIPWLFGATLPALDDDVWELYDTTTDWTQVHDLAAEHPEKLAAFQRLFLIEAVKYNVLPLDDRRIERFNSEIAGRPQLAKGPSQIFFGGMCASDREHRLEPEKQVLLSYRGGRRTRRRRQRA